MLKLNIWKIARVRGIKNLPLELQKWGFNKLSSYRFNENRVKYFRLAEIEKLCLMLNCTPNDLFVWKPEKVNSTNNKDLALNKLNGQESPDIIELTKTMPLDKFPEIKKILDELG